MNSSGEPIFRHFRKRRFIQAFGCTIRIELHSFSRLFKIVILIRHYNSFFFFSSGRSERPWRLWLRLRRRGRRRAPLRGPRSPTPASRRSPLLGVRLRGLPTASPPQRPKAQEKAENGRAANARRQTQESRRLYDVSLGVPAQTPPGQGVLSAFHQMDKPWEGRLQVSGFEGGVPTMGLTQKQARHELWDDGPRFTLLLPEGHPGEGGRPAARLPVRGRAQRHCWDRLLASVDSSDQWQPVR